MELARQASSKQQQQAAASSSSSKQQAPQGPFWALEQQGPEIEKKCYPAIRDGFPLLSREQLFFSVTVGNGDLVGFWQNMAPWRNSGPGPKTEKRNFPVLGVQNWEKKLVGCPQLSYTLSFDRPDPHGRENAKYEDFGPFWLRTAVGT